MYQVFKIDIDQLPAAAGRTIKTALKIMILVYITMSLYMALWMRLSVKYIALGALVYIPAYSLALWLGYVLLKQRFRRYRIVLDDDGVQFFMPPNDKKIAWRDLQLIEKADGTLDLRDRTRSAAVRWLTGEGQITVLPELGHFDQLQQEISKRSTTEII